MYFRVAAAAPQLNVGDCEYNTKQILSVAETLASNNVELAVFPELCISGYTCGDLFHNHALIEATLNSITTILEWSAKHSLMIMWIGASIPHKNSLYNCALAIQGGRLLAVIPKTYLPNYNEFYEKRWWASGHGVDGFTNLNNRLDYEVPFGTRNLIRTASGITIGAEICEDLWSTIPPSSLASLAGAQIIVNLSASNDLIGKYDYLIDLIKSQSAKCMGAYVYASSGFGESTTDLVFDGKCIIAENGSILKKSDRWNMESHFTIADIDMWAINRDRLHVNTFGDCSRVNIKADNEYNIINSNIDTNQAHSDSLLHDYSPTPFIPGDDNAMEKRNSEIINIQTFGLVRRLKATGCKNAVIGISGGLDSTLALLVTVKAFDTLGLDRKGITGVTMPGFGTTGRTHNNATVLMESLGISTREISIVPAVNQHFADIGHNPEIHDVTYENSQARERTQLLMDIANQVGGMVIGTGDLSELALGWATYNGDHMSMYGVNAGIPKTLVKYLVKWFAMHTDNDNERMTLLDIIDTPISPELIPADSEGNITQKTEDLVGPYELHDFFIYHTLRYGRTITDIRDLALHLFGQRYDEKTILHWLETFTRRFFNQQFKRSCMPDGPKVGSVCLSPRGDWRMPSDAASKVWNVPRSY